MKKITEFLINEVEEFKEPRDKLAQKVLGAKKISNPKTDLNFDVKTKKDTSKRASYKKGEDISAYENSNLNVREELTRDIIDLLNEVSKERLKNYIQKGEDDYSKRVLGRTPEHTVDHPYNKKTRSRATSLNKAEKKLSDKGVTTSWKHGIADFKEEREEYDENGSGRHKVVYTHPDKKNVGNDRFELKSKAHAYASSLKKKGYHDVRVTEDVNIEESEGKVTTTVWSNAGRHEWIINKGDKLHKRSGLIHSTRAKAISDLKKNLRKDMKEEVELDEISKKVVKSYGNKVMKQLTDMKKKQLRGSRLSDEDKDNLRKRVPGLQMAQRHAYKKGYAKDAWKEEVELDEISKGRLGAYIKSASHDVAARSAAVGRHSDRANRAMDSVKAGNGESYEQQQDRRKESATADKHFQKSWKRRGNIAKAVDKLTKEEVEISEVSKDRLKAYVQKSKASWDSARDDYDNPKKRAGANKTMGKRMTGLDDAKKRLKENANSNDHLIGAHNYLMSLSGPDRVAIHKKANNGDLSLKVKNQRNTINHILKTVPKDVLAKHAPEKFEESVGLDETSPERKNSYGAKSLKSYAFALSRNKSNRPEDKDIPVNDPKIAAKRKRGLDRLFRSTKE